MSDINALIDEQVKNNDVFLYMKGTPDFPMCGFSGRVVQILELPRRRLFQRQRAR
jgi:monothiol glutaredoxin